MALVVLVLLLLAAPSRPVQAQTPEPTATPTPSWQQEVPLTSGNTVLIERRVTYGDMAIVIAVLAVGLLLFFFGVIGIPKKWT